MKFIRMAIMLKLIGKKVTHVHEASVNLLLILMLQNMFIQFLLWQKKGEGGGFMVRARDTGLSGAVQALACDIDSRKQRSRVV